MPIDSEMVLKRLIRHLTCLKEDVEGVEESEGLNMQHTAGFTQGLDAAITYANQSLYVAREFDI